MLNYIRKNDKDAFDVLIGKTKKLVATDKNQMVAELATFDELCNNIWMLFGEYIDDTTYQHRLVEGMAWRRGNGLKKIAHRRARTE